MKTIESKYKPSIRKKMAYPTEREMNIYLLLADNFDFNYAFPEHTEFEKKYNFWLRKKKLEKLEKLDFLSDDKKITK